MNLLASGVKIIDPHSPYHQQVTDILIVDGVISRMGKDLKPNEQLEKFDAEGHCVSPGWLDSLASFGDPGFEYKEDLDSGTNAAAQGGFTAVAIMPNTEPALHSKSEIEYIRNKNRGHLTEVIPIGSISRSRKGEELTEMYDMHLSGAVAFSEADKPVSNAGLMLRALRYVKAFKGLIIDMPYDQQLAGHGQLNEGEISTILGLPGIPAVSEELMIQRDIRLAEYAGSKLHFGAISSGQSVELIRQARKRELDISASVSAYQLLLTDEALGDYDTIYKVLPPLRKEEDRLALIEGLKDGTIESICSLHVPQDKDAKRVEFENAAFGMSSMESTFAVLFHALKGQMKPEEIIATISRNPRRIMGIDQVTIKEGEEANLTFFKLDMPWEFQKHHIQSKSLYNPFIGKTFDAKATAVYNRQQFYRAK